MQPQKLALITVVGCGLQKYNTFSEKVCKNFDNFFLYFPEFFLAILMKPNRAKQSVVERG
jgi:hypothetical protein